MLKQKEVAYIYVHGGDVMIISPKDVLEVLEILV